MNTSDTSAPVYKRDYSIIPNSEGDNINVYTYSVSMKAKGEKVQIFAATTDDYQTITIAELPAGTGD